MAFSSLARSRTIRVPASSANLGPGFDVMGAALDLHMEVDVVETGEFAVHTDLQIARDRRNLIVRGFAALAPPDQFEFTIRSDIPLSGGLGTSAAAIVAGLVAADSIFKFDVKYSADQVTTNDLLDITATVRFTPPTPVQAGMVVLDIAVPTGFAPETATIESLVKRTAKIKRWDIAGRKVIFYIQDLAPDESVTVI